MLTSLFENDLSTRKATKMLDLCKKFIPWTRNEVTKVAFREDLERLALSAPHMLSDIGFVRDVKASSREKVVWRRGRHCVIISNAPHTASASA